jgi:hypothetical protein
VSTLQQRMSICKNGYLASAYQGDVTRKTACEVYTPVYIMLLQSGLMRKVMLLGVSE